MLRDERGSKLRVIMTENGIYEKFDDRKTIATSWIDDS
jgi:hypothetical protein